MRKTEAEVNSYGKQKYSCGAHTFFALIWSPFSAQNLFPNLAPFSSLSNNKKVGVGFDKNVQIR